MPAWPFVFYCVTVKVGTLDIVKSSKMWVTIMETHTVLISGAGIAGPTLAYWLDRAGLRPTLIEHAPSLRSGGYVIDFWGLGYDIADRMGLSGDLDRLGYHMHEMRIVDENGERETGFGTNVFRELTGGRFVTVRRSDLALLLFETANPVSEIIFGDEINGLEQDRDGVNVTFRHARSRRFDLVIGADGLHSNLRNLVFGPQHQFERSLGYAVAAFEAQGYRPRDENVYILHNKPGRMLARLALRDDRTLFLLVFADNAGDITSTCDVEAQKVHLRSRFRDSGWESARILDELEHTDDLYYDRVSQVHLQSWSRGRVALVGDAAFCASLMAGQGSALAVTAAYVLAGELARMGGSHEKAFQRYETLLRPYIESKQRGAKKFSRAFAPRTALGLFVRNCIIGATAIPGLARLAFGRETIDKLVLPEYIWD
jgi:2-polyprenyl-6-methoxyphenol hydroxylase-like FAD-dependent oxidoreductase